jgi:transcriptional regulator GlxA family with amidase domain
MEPRIEQAITLLTSDLRREVPLTEIAQSINLSASHLRYLFIIETGLAPQQYLNAKRMQRAKELLETTFLNVKEIMLAVGIKDQSHFVRNFQKTYGLSPVMHRKQCIQAKTQTAKATK